MQLKTNSACWRPYSEDARSFKLSAKNKRLIKQRRTLTSSSNRLWPFTQFMKIITRDIHNTQPSKMQHPWLMAMIYRHRNWHKLQSKHTMISQPKNRRTAVKIVFPQSSKAFVQRPIPFFPEIYRACIYISGILQRFVKNFLNRESLIFSAKDWTKTSLGIL